MAWQNRARRWLAGGSEEVGALLDAVLLEHGELTAKRERELHVSCLVPFPFRR